MRTVFAFLLAGSTAGFIFPDPIMKPGLAKKIDSQTEQRRLSVTLEIGEAGTSSRMGIKGMIFDFHKDTVDDDHTRLPGVNGPHPNLSSGARRLSIVEEGKFVGMTGTQVVKILKPCWEMIWREDSPAGALVCGFEVPEDYKRNDATLPRGTVYITFPIWTEDTLAFGRSEKVEIMAKANSFLDEKNEALQKMNATNNPFMKALHFRTAAAATEQYGYQPLMRAQSVPDQDEDLEFQGDIRITTKGLVWTKTSTKDQQKMLGTASISPVSKG